MIKKLILVTMIMGPFSVRAELLRILHTNDLHAQLRGVRDDQKLGGYAELKSQMDKITEVSNQAGVPVLRLDGGDFSEGALAYKANDGLNVFEIIEMMGYDAVALGNHDYLMGPKRFAEILSETNLPLVAANIKIDKDESIIKRKLLPFRMIQKGGLKIGVVGGTTSDIFYRWVLKDHVKFTSPEKDINQMADKLVKNTDLTIALTHIGLVEDKKVIEHGKNIDLVVGGHSHEKFEKPIMVKNKKNHEIAVVQSGEHGRFLGDLLIDVDNTKAHGQRVKIISYKLHPIVQKSDQDLFILAKIEETQSDIEAFFGKDYLYESLGISSLRMETFPDRPSYWSNFFTDAIKEETGSQIAMNNHVFLGPVQPAGDVTREKIMNFFPRYFDLENKDGWTIYTAQVKGNWVKRLVQLSVKLGYPFLVSGMTYKVVTNEKGEKVATHFKFGDKDLDNKKRYKVAIPEGYYRGLSSLSDAVADFILKDVQDSRVAVWTAVEKKLKRTVEFQ